MDMELKTLLVDDELLCLEALRSSLNAFSYVNIVGEILNGSDVVKIMEKAEMEIDLIFLDIEIKDVNGFELAKFIQSKYPKIKIIFLTGHAGFALKGYEYEPIDFLTKPINMIRLEQALSRVKNMKYNNEAVKDVKIGIHVEGGIEIISVKDIAYIEKKGRKVCIVCKNKDIFNSRDSLQKLESIFGSYGFFRCHQSFLIPIDNVKSVYADEFSRTYTIQLNEVKETIPLSRDKYVELKELLKKNGMKFYL